MIIITIPSYKYLTYKKELLKNQYMSIKILEKKFLKQFLKICQNRFKLRNIVKEWIPVKYDSASLLLSLNKIKQPQMMFSRANNFIN